jgi:two-component system, OmpR family, response regulator RegX3
VTDPKRILVVDDEAAILEAVAYALRGEGFDVDALEDGEAALDAALTNGYDLLILDLMLPKLSGLEVCRRIRDRSDVPILILTARDSEGDRVLGLESGADDYVSKPFSMAELLSRVRAILRRRALDRLPGEKRVGGIRIDLERYSVEVDGRPVDLTQSEFRLLALLAGAPGRTLTRDEIMRHLWRSTYTGDRRACDTHVSNLRRKIERDPSRPERIVAVRGVGYRLEPV